MPIRHKKLVRKYFPYWMTDDMCDIIWSYVQNKYPPMELTWDELCEKFNTYNLIKLKTFKNRSLTDDEFALVVTKCPNYLDLRISINLGHKYTRSEIGEKLKNLLGPIGKSLENLCLILCYPRIINAIVQEAWKRNPIPAKIYPWHYMKPELEITKYTNFLNMYDWNMILYPFMERILDKLFDEEPWATGSIKNQIITLVTEDIIGRYFRVNGINFGCYARRDKIGITCLLRNIRTDFNKRFLQIKWWDKKEKENQYLGNYYKTHVIHYDQIYPEVVKKLKDPKFLIHYLKEKLS